MRLPLDIRAACADQKIKVAALVGLQYVIDIKLVITALIFRLRAGRTPFCKTRLNLFLRHEKLELSRRAIELDFVASLDNRQRSACLGLPVRHEE